jgi:hypothetical protein
VVERERFMPLEITESKRLVTCGLEHHLQVVQNMKFSCCHKSAYIFMCRAPSVRLCTHPFITEWSDYWPNKIVKNERKSDVHVGRRGANCRVHGQVFTIR